MKVKSLAACAAVVGFTALADTHTFTSDLFTSTGILKVAGAGCAILLK